MGIAGCASRTTPATAPESTPLASPVTRTPAETPTVTQATVTPRPTRTPSELRSPPEFTFTGTSPSVREFELKADQQFVVFTLAAASDVHLQTLIESEDNTYFGAIGLNGERYTEKGAYLERGTYTVDVGGEGIEWQLTVSVIPDASIYALPATISGTGPTIVGKYRFDGYTRFTDLGSEDSTITIFMIAPDAQPLVSMRDAAVKDLSGDYFLFVDADGPWHIQMEAENTSK